MRLAMVMSVAVSSVVVAFAGRGGGAVAGTASVKAPKRWEVLVVGANGHGLRQLTSGKLWYRVLAWLPGSPAVAEVAFTGATHTAWIESQPIDGQGHRKLSATVPTLEPSFAFSEA